MNNFTRIVWAATLCTFVSGCASVYRPAGLPGEAQENTTADQMDTVHEGDTVRVTLISGSEVTGKFVERSSEILTLHCDGRAGYQKREIVISEIEKVEIKEGTGRMTTAGTVVVLVLAVGLGVSLYMASTMDITFGNSN